MKDLRIGVVVCNAPIGEIQSNLDKLSKNVDQVSKLQRKDPDDKFEEVMSIFNEKADSEYNLCKVLKGNGSIPYILINL